MIITKLALPRRTFLRGVGATLALPVLDAMVPAFGGLSAAATPVRRLGVRLHPDGLEHRRVDAAAGGPPHRAVADAGAADAVLRSGDGAQQPRAEERLLDGQPRDGELHVPERRAGQDDRRLRLRAGRHGRSDRRAADRQGHAAAVARARHRLQLRRRQLRQRLRLRLHEHAGVVVADDAAADRGEPARGVRADVRRRRHGRRAQGRAAEERQHPRLGDRGHGAARAHARAARPHAGRRVSRHRARGRAAHPEGRAAGRRCAAGSARRGRSACPRTGKSTRS